MQDKTRFAEEIRDHVCHELLTDELVELAFDAGLERDAVLDILHPLLVRHTPFHAVRLLHSVLPDAHLTLKVLDTTLAALRALRGDAWQARTLRDTVQRAAAEHALAPADAQAICAGWMLFGTSSLELYSSMQALGREQVCRRCETALEALRAGVLVS
ncbi:hypothetical protein QZM68_25970 [Burkholderia gladioli]|uniref:hypothetical protein n=1 Tax=Burkholderia gladioli TaxID=28095 RepID=UPI002655B4C2|nr:hypothetical protein [Burkholderia gladioli]MDN7603210.1 hypothetical protein [Burkholderia gladioli]